ncbi:protein NDRG3 isoform X1 [Ctenocephalides felis]|uniref:protein NDRG3 isoform X1 n=2 Tax=Ctenocephalides felis TaxID=7515 RepID=UPI000E6E1B56|nr:protein NDRG3 isoform X1 [Ctenocephalides felis]
MPQVLGPIGDTPYVQKPKEPTSNTSPVHNGGYTSLGNAGGNVYMSTTEPTTPSSVIDTVKRAFTGGSTNQKTGAGEPLLNANGRSNKIVSGRQTSAANIANVRNTNSDMPAPNSAEETALLGNTMPCDPMDDIELKSIQLQFPSSRTAPRQSIGTISRVPTDHGELQVAVVGDCTKPAILTYHDLGLNYSSSFSAFFNYPSMRALLENFCVYHVTAPGQEEGAPTYPEDYVYPTMDQLAGQLPFVLTHFGLKSVIGFGVGFGANVLARFAIEHPEQVGALCLVNCVSTVSGWIEWGYQKLNARHLKSKGMTQGVVDYLMWHHFGRNTEERNHDLVQVYKNYFEQQINPVNLSMLIDTYLRRTDMNIARSPTSGPQNNDMTLKMPVMNITGSLSPHVDDTVTLNGRLDPKNSTWMKISECGMVLEEQPAKVSEAFRLFLQGEGYAVGALQKLSRLSISHSSDSISY